MNAGVKVGIYLILILCAVLLGTRFLQEYQRVMDDRADSSSGNLEDVPLRDYQAALNQTQEPDRTSTLGLYAAGFFAVVVALGLMTGHAVSRYFGGRAGQAIYNEQDAPTGDPTYERAEHEWANGNHLEAIRLMREYLQNHPREQHVALRIAEIYEKDLQNFLASALEYEEILKEKLSPERWGWAAIHLCNLYNGRLGQPAKAIQLLRRITAEHPKTAAAEKARKRLAEIDASGDPLPDLASVEDSSPSPPNPVPRPADPTPTARPASNLPPGFAPKKG